LARQLGGQILGSYRPATGSESKGVNLTASKEGLLSGRVGEIGKVPRSLGLFPIRFFDRRFPNLVLEIRECPRLSLFMQPEACLPMNPVIVRLMIQQQTAILGLF
jgi:hypothetical protein